MRKFAELDAGTDPSEFVANVRAVLSRYSRPVYPDRPELGLGDADIVEQLGRHAAGKPVTKQDAEQLKLFGVWRASVWKSEEKAAGNVRVVCSAILACEAAGGDASDMRQFLTAEYGGLPEKFDELDVLQIVERLSMNVDVLPRYFRTGEMRHVPRDLVAQKRVRKLTKRLSEGDAYEGD